MDPLDEDIDDMSRGELVAEVKKLRQGVRRNRSTLNHPTRHARSDRMSTHIRTGFITLFVLLTAWSEGARESPGADTGSNTGANAGAGIDSLNTRLVEAYRRRDPAAYGALYTDTAVFEWPAFNTVRSPAGLEGLEAMVGSGSV